MQLNRRFFLYTSTAFVIASLSGCRSTPSKTIRVGTNVWPGYESLYLARDLGYYDNSPIKLVDYPSATEVSRALRNGDIEVAALTLDETLLLSETNPDIRVVLIMDVSAGGDAILAHPSIKTMTELKGKRVGVESNALGAFFISRALEEANLSLSDIEVVSLGVSEHEQAYNNGKVDAVVTFEPVRSNLLDSGAHLIFDSTQIPGEIIDVLVVPKNILDNQTESLTQLLDGWFNALGYLDQNPSDAAQRMAPRENISPQQFLDSLSLLHIPNLKENKDWLNPNNPKLKQGTAKLAQVMTQQQLLTQQPSINTLFDPRLVQALP